MKSKLLLFTVVLCFIYAQSYAQQLVKTEYFKDEKLSKPCREKSASFRLEEWAEPDSIQLLRVVNVKQEKVWSEKRYKNAQPYGQWQLTVNYTQKNLLYAPYKIEGAYYNDTLPGYTPAVFPGGEKEMMRFIGKDIVYPSYAKEYDIQGEVQVTLHIDASGKAKVHSVYKSAHYILDLEACRVLKSLPRFTPAYKDGEAIESYRILPVFFVIAG